MKIVVSAEVWQENVGGSNPDDAWSRDSYIGGVKDVSARTAREGEKYYDYHESWSGELNVGEGGIVHAVVLEYTTGDSFGSNGGNARIADVFTDNTEALELAAAFRVNENEWSFDHNGKEYHNPGAGYFERLDSVSVHSVAVDVNTVEYF